MTGKKQELKSIVKQFAESGWDLIDAPSKLWLEYDGDCEETTAKLIEALKEANKQCGTCGCEMDALYGKALQLLNAE